MVSEILAIPEEYLVDFIRLLRTGLEHCDPPFPEEEREGLEKWIADIEEYLNG